MPERGVPREKSSDGLTQGMISEAKPTFVYHALVRGRTTGDFSRGVENTVRSV